MHKCLYCKYCTVTYKNEACCACLLEIRKFNIKDDLLELIVNKFIQHICSICLDEMRIRERSLSCKKCFTKFHYSCLNEWVTRKGNCPICRNKFNT